MGAGITSITPAGGASTDGFAGSGAGFAGSGFAGSTAGFAGAAGGTNETVRAGAARSASGAAARGGGRAASGSFTNETARPPAWRTAAPAGRRARARWRTASAPRAPGTAVANAAAPSARGQLARLARRGVRDIAEVARVLGERGAEQQQLLGRVERLDADVEDLETVLLLDERADLRGRRLRGGRRGRRLGRAVPRRLEGVAEQAAVDLGEARELARHARQAERDERGRVAFLRERELSTRLAGAMQRGNLFASACSSSTLSSPRGFSTHAWWQRTERVAGRWRACSAARNASKRRALGFCFPGRSKIRAASASERPIAGTPSFSSSL
jgi:hypothetical protein